MPSHRDTALPAASWCRAGSEPALVLLHVEVAVSRPEVPLPPWGFPGSFVLPSSCPAAGAHPLPPCSPTEVCLCIPHAAVILGGCSRPCVPLGFHVGSGAAKDGGQEGDGAVGQPHSAPRGSLQSLSTAENDHPVPQPVPGLFGSELPHARFHTLKDLRGGQGNVSLWGCVYVRVCIHWGGGVVFVCCSCLADVREIGGGSSGSGQGLPACGPAASSVGPRLHPPVPVCPPGVDIWAHWGVAWWHNDILVA